MTEEEIIDCVRRVRTQKNALHKPLLLLLALKRYELGERELPFDTVDRELDWLLQEFRTHSSPVHPHYPFWHLQNDCEGRLWEVDLPHKDKMRYDIVGRDRRPRKEDLRKYGGTGRLRPEVLEALDRNKHLCARLVGVILDYHVSPHLHTRVLEALGMGLGESGGETEDLTAPRPIDFRREVLLAYNSRCAICDFTVTMENSLIGLEAAHIRWRSSEGPDIVTNGLALCANHHRMFDRGVFSLAGPEDDYSILVARNAQFAGGLEEARRTARGMHFSLPLREQDNPSADYLAWHRENVFERRRQRTSPTP